MGYTKALQARVINNYDTMVYRNSNKHRHPLFIHTISHKCYYYSLKPIGVTLS